MTDTNRAPDHIVDATEKVQPARCPHCGYTPDALPSDFAAYEQANCGHRESHAEPAPAPMPELSDRATLRERLDGFADPVDAAITIIVAHESALEGLTRRLDEAEERLVIAHMDGYHKGQKAGQSEHNNSVRMGQYILEAEMEKRLREAAEARVRELEAEAKQLGREKQAAEAQRKVAENACERNYNRASMAEVERDDLQAFKSRVMAWARGRCECCRHRGRPRTCWTCTDHEDKPNWTPPQALEVGE